MTMYSKILSGLGRQPRMKLGRLVACHAFLLISQFSIIALAQSTEVKNGNDPNIQADADATPDKDREDSRRSESDREKELREAVEREREARAGTTKSLNEKLAELEASPDKRLDLTFDDLVFDMEKGERFKPSMLTKDIGRIHKKKVSLSGYILPSDRRTMTKFVLVRDNKECCFGPGAALFDCVMVRMAEGVKAEYTVRPIRIEGDFYLKEFKLPDGTCLAIYGMKNGMIK